MSKFAAYEPEGRHGVEPAIYLGIAVAGAEHIEGLASLTAEREGGDPGRYVSSLRAQTEAPPSHGRVFVGTLAGDVVGLAKVSRLGDDQPSLPGGWYLSGMMVAEPHRRRGIGRRLTEHRIAWLRDRTERIHYFASLRNRASIILHEQLGFEEVRRNIRVPGVAFTGGVGALYVLSWPEDRAASKPASSA